MIQRLIDHIDLFHNPFIVEDDVIDYLPHQDIIKKLDSVASKKGSYYTALCQVKTGKGLWKGLYSTFGCMLW